MATDNTPPRLRLIGTISVIVVITVIGLDFVFKSYYAYMTDMAQREKLAPTRDKEDQRAAEAAAFAGAKVPIDQAMAQLKGTRSALVEPKPSEDVGALTGWSKLPKQPPLPAPGAMVPGGMMVHGPDTSADAGAADGGGPTSAGDAGPMATDGGVHAADAGAAPAPAPKGGAAKDGGARAPH